MGLKAAVWPNSRRVRGLRLGARGRIFAERQSARLVGALVNNHNRKQGGKRRRAAARRSTHIFALHIDALDRRSLISWHCKFLALRFQDFGHLRRATSIRPFSSMLSTAPRNLYAKSARRRSKSKTHKAPRSKCFATSIEPPPRRMRTTRDRTASTRMLSSRLRASSSAFIPLLALQMHETLRLQSKKHYEILNKRPRWRFGRVGFEGMWRRHSICISSFNDRRSFLG